VYAIGVRPIFHPLTHEIALLRPHSNLRAELRSPQQRCGPPTLSTRPPDERKNPANPTATHSRTVTPLCVRLPAKFVRVVRNPALPQNARVPLDRVITPPNWNASDPRASSSNGMPLDPGSRHRSPIFNDERSSHQDGKIPAYRSELMITTPAPP
jgi:hypothetical protein